MEGNEEAKTVMMVMMMVMVMVMVMVMMALRKQSKNVRDADATLPLIWAVNEIARVLVMMIIQLQLVMAE